MLFSIFLLNFALLFLSLINFISIRKPESARDVEQSILVLLPVRNEEANIARIIGELENQVNLPNFTVLVIDDSSEDKTFEIASTLTSNRIHVMRAPEPRAGWLGKVSALQSGLESSGSAEVVISIDADVHFHQDAISRAVASLQASQLDFISPYPRQLAYSWAERLAQPLLQWSWMSTVLLRGAEKIPLTSTVICNGQFLVMKGSSLREIGGFTSVAHKVLDDIELGRSFIKSGFKGSVIDGSALSSTRMYSSLLEIKAGYGKSLHAAFGSPVGALFAALFMLLTGVIPILYALTGDFLAIASVVAIIGTRIVSAAASSSRLRDSFLHPLSCLLFTYLLYFSWRNKGRVQWKGRTV